MHRGVYPAVVTPFDSQGQVDHVGLTRLLSLFAANGCKGVVLAGTNGEGASLDAFEKRDMARVLAPIAKCVNLELILGIATSSLTEAQWLCRQAAKAGADAVLLMPPSYFREADQSAIEGWFRAVLDSSEAPVILYNFPKRTGISLSADLLSRLGSHERLIGVKDSSGEADNIAAYRTALPEKLLYVGDETLLLAALGAGWTGTISGASNVLSPWLAQIVADYPSESAAAKFDYLLPGLRALRACPQPASNKGMLRRMGIIDSDQTRLPLLPARPEDIDRLAQALTSYLGGAVSPPAGS